MSEISVIIPAFNEESEIGKVLSRLETLRAAIPAMEIIVVNDASTDRTATVVAAFPGVRLIENAENAGYGRSLKNGIAAATYDTVAIIDADNTYPANDIPALLKLMEKYEMVVGRRDIIVYPKLNWLKQRGRNVIDLLCSYLAGAWIPDINSGLRLFRKSTIAPFINELCDRFSFTTSLTLLMFFSKHNVHYEKIVYNTGPTQRKTKVRIWKDGYRTLGLIITLGFRHRPVRTALLFAVPLAVLSVLL